MGKVRLSLLAGAGALALTGAFAKVDQAQAQTVEGPSVNWKLSVWGKRRAFTEGMEHVASELDKRTGGKFKLKLYYGGQLSKPKENLDGISLNAFEAAMFCGSYHPGKNAPLTVLDLPFLPVGDFEVQRKMHDAVFSHPASIEALAKWNATLYISNLLPLYEYMGRGEAPKGVEDFEGKRLRALGGMGEAARKIGATTLTMPSSETYTALQRGTVDAIGLPNTYAFAAFKLDEVADWVTTNMKLGTVTCPTVFNTKAYEKLPEQYKTLLDELKDGAYETLKTKYAEQDEKNYANWKKGGKLKLVEIPSDQMKEFRKIAGEPVWKAWVEQYKDTLPAQELLDLVLEASGVNR